MIRRISVVLVAVVIGTLSVAAPASAASGKIRPMGEVHCC
jgi:hypothetical protein